MVNEVQVVSAGVSFGTALAIVISWWRNRSLLWAIVHGVLSWLYVISRPVLPSGARPAERMAQR